MSKSSLRKREPTDHHTIPSTLGGSDDPVTLITGIERRDHNNYHAWADNRPPCFSVRRAMLNAIGGKFTPEPEVLRNVLEITTMPDWQKLYDPAAFVPVSAIGARQKAEKSAAFQVTFWKEEEVLIRNTMHSLLNGQAFPNATDAGQGFESKLFVSMKSDNVRDALHRLLTQKHTKKRLMWVNPMHEVTREALLEWTEEMPRRSKIIDAKCGGVRNGFETILAEQLRHLNAYIRAREGEQERWAENPYVIPSGQ